MSSRSLLTGLAVAIALALALPASAPAGLVTTNYDAIVAAGEGTTRCLRSDNIYDRPFSDRWEWHATIDCDVPVRMFAEAWWIGDDWNDYSWGCDAVMAKCVLGGGDQGEFQGGRIDHHFRLRAPMGQGWVVAPTGCSGIGTDLLECRE